MSKTDQIILNRKDFERSLVEIVKPIFDRQTELEEKQNKVESRVAN